MSQEPISFGRRVRQLAEQRPDEAGLVFAPEEGAERPLTRRDLEERSNRLARLLAEHGVDAGSTLAVGLRNSPEHVLATLAGWKLGARVVPQRWDLPRWERDRMLEVADPALVIADWEDEPRPRLTTTELARAAQRSADPLEDRVPDGPIAIGTGGSTGTPKVVVMPFPGELVPGDAFGPLGHWLPLEPGTVHLIGGPLYHGNPFAMTHVGLFDRHRIVLMERFSAAGWVDLVERHRVQFCTLVPTMMKRIIERPDIHERDLSSLRAVLHTAAPCPPSLKEAWIDLIGGERLYEAFGSSESVGYMVIRGDEWLEHRGSIGRPFRTEVRVLDDEGNELPPGEVGELYMRLEGTTQPAYEYLGSQPAEQTDDGFVSVGDLGYVDGDGWYYSADRRLDMIITGGSNVYPAEVEAALVEHPQVADAVVVGLPDPEWGARVHAIVEPADADAPPSEEELDQHCRGRLAAYKVPKSYEVVRQLPRTAMGKIRRSQLRAERT